METQIFAEDFYNVSRDQFILLSYERFNGNSGAMQDALDHFDMIQMELAELYQDQQ